MENKSAAPPAGDGQNPGETTNSETLQEPVEPGSDRPSQAQDVSRDQLPEQDSSEDEHLEGGEPAPGSPGCIGYIADWVTKPLKLVQSTKDRMQSPDWIKKHPKKVIKYFKQYSQVIEQSSQVIEGLHSELEHTKRSLKDKEREYNSVLQRSQQLEYERIEADKARMSLAELERENEELRSRNRELEEDKLKLLSELSTKSRDQSTLTTLSHGSRQTISQEFKSICDAVHRYARHLVRVEVEASDTLEPKEARTIRAQRIAFCSSAIFQNLSSERTSQEQLIEMVAKEINQPKSLLLEAGSEDIRRIWERWQQLFKVMAESDPPVEIFFEPPGSKCDRSNSEAGRLEAHRSCREFGTVKFTVYPGLQAGNRTIVHAVVWVDGKEGDGDGGFKPENRLSRPA